MSSLPGHTGQDAILFIEDDLLLNTEASEQMDIIIDTATRDTNHPEATTHLRRGLLMAEVTASGKYKEFDSGNADGTQLSAGVVVLGYEVRDIDEGDKSAMAYFAGTFNAAKLVVHDGGTDPTWADVQRIQRR
jgi:hypothetical protein